MQHILERIHTSGKCVDLSNRDLERVQFISSPKNHLMGVHLGNDFLVLDVTTYSSFRIRPQNIGFLEPIELYTYSLGFDKSFMDDYFKGCDDNPYAIQFVANISRRGTAFIPEANITRFPPLFYRKPPEWYRTACDRLLTNARFGDMLFSFDRSSGISNRIRRIDKGPWSHVALIYRNSNVVEMTTSGISRSKLAEQFKTERDFALYRGKDTVTEEQENKMEEYIRRSLAMHVPFSYLKLGVTFLRKKYGLFRHLRLASVADLAYSNKLNLISYC